MEKVKQTKQSLAELAFQKQIEELQEAFRQQTKDIQSLVSSYGKSVFEEDENDEDENDDDDRKSAKQVIKSKFDFLQSAFAKANDLKDSIAESLVVVGELIHSSKNNPRSEEFETNKIIKNLDIELKECDFDALTIVSYLTNTAITPTKEDSLTLAEVNLAIAKELEPHSKSAAKFAMLKNAIIPLIINKNILSSSEFKNAYTQRDNFNIDERILISALEKLKEFNQIRTQNEKLIVSLADISLVDMQKQEVSSKLNKLKNISLNKSYLQESLTQSHFLISNEEYTSIPTAKSDKNEIFIDYAQKYLELKLPDPENRLQNKLNEILCTQSNKIYSPDPTLSQTPKIIGGQYAQSNRLKL